MLRRAGAILGVAAVLLMFAVASGLLCDGPGGEQTYMSVTCDVQIDDGLTIDASDITRAKCATIDTDDGTQYAEPANKTQAGDDARARVAILSEYTRTNHGDTRAGPHYDGLPTSNASGYVTWDGGRHGVGVRARA